MNLGQLPVRIDVIPVPYADQKLPCSIGALFVFFALLIFGFKENYDAPANLAEYSFI